MLTALCRDRLIVLYRWLQRQQVDRLSLPQRRRPLLLVALAGLVLVTTLPAHTETTAANPGPVKKHAVAMHGDPHYPPGFSHFDYVNPDAPKTGTVRLAAQGTFDSLNQFIAKGTAEQNLGLLYDTLTVGSMDEAFSRYGLIAESMQIAEDRSWVIFHLRPEARFHDGQPIRAKDVVTTFDLLLEQGSPVFQSMFSELASVTAIDPLTVRFAFSSTENRELALIVGDIPILPSHYWAERDFSKTSLEPPLGSGPYRISSVDSGRNIVYTRVSDYWASDLPVRRGMFNFDRVTVDYYKDAIVLLEALKAGEYDLRVENSAKQWATGYTGRAVSAGLLKTEEIRHENPTGMQAFLMNQRRSLFQDRRVRQALTLAFDYEWANKNLFYDAYTRTESYFSNSELASSGLPTAAELAILEPFRDQLPDSVFSQPFDLPETDASGYNRQNLRRAKQLLEEAGWRVRDNQLYHQQTGQPFRFEIMLVSPSFERIVNPFVKGLNKLGIDVSVRIVEASQYINRMRTFDYDMTTVVIPQSLSPGNEQMQYWHSSTANTEGGRNYMGISHPVIDQLVEAVIRAPDRESLVDRSRALDRVLLNQYYCIPHWHIRSHRLAYWDIFSRPEVSPKYDPYFDLSLYTWWIDEDKQRRVVNARQRLKN